MRVMEEWEAASEPPNSGPWLVIPYDKRKLRHALYNIFEPDNTNCRKFFIHELSGKSFWQKPSHQGWLIVLCDVKDEYFNSMTNCRYGDCFLWNPLTLERIPLPSLLKWITIEPYYMLDCVLSSPPRNTACKDVDSTNDDSDPLVLVMYQPCSNYGSCTFLFCHPGEKQWRTQLFFRKTDNVWDIKNLRCFKGKLYALGITGDCLEIETKNQVDNGTSLFMKKFHVSDLNIPLEGTKDVLRTRTYFVEGHDDLFKITLYYNCKVADIYDPVITSIFITRLDFILMQWELVNNLGDDVLFVGGKNSICCSAAKLGLARGCLYYTLPFDGYSHTTGSEISSEDMGLYKFEVESDGDYDISPCLRLLEPVFAPDWIMMPERKDGKLGITEKDQNYISKALEHKLSITCDNDSQNTNPSLCVGPNAQELEENTPWRILNDDMMMLISSYVHPLDYVYFRAVCRANRQIMPVVKSTFTSTKIFETTSISPWLLFSRDNSSTVYSLVNPMHENENYLINFSELLLGATIRYQNGGWLLMSREVELFFYNPFTREIIMLPDFPGCYEISDISFTSIPTCSDCIVFATEGTVDLDYSDSEIFHIHCIKRGNREWDIFHLNVTKYWPYSPLRNTPVSFHGDFYAVGYDGDFVKLDLKDDGYYQEIIVKGLPQFDDTYPSFLAECGDDLLLVKLRGLKTPVRIFRLDFSKLEWVKVESLGKHMLFISGITCFSAVAPTRRMENKVYFPRLCLNGEGVLFYSLETGRYHSFGSQHFATNFCGTQGWLRNCTWIEPNWAKFTPQELDWLKPPSLP